MKDQSTHLSENADELIPDSQNIEIFVICADSNSARMAQRYISSSPSHRATYFETFPVLGSNEAPPHLVMVHCAPGNLMAELRQIQGVVNALPQVPVIAYGDNLDADYRLAFWNAGVADIFSSQTSTQDAECRLMALFRLARVSTIMLAQAKALARSLDRQRETNNLLTAQIRFREQAERNLKEFQQTMFQSARLSALGELASELFHEINTPLTVLKGSVDIFLKRLATSVPGAQDVREFCERLKTHVGRIERISRGVRVASRDTMAGSTPLSAISLHDVVTDVKSLVDPKCRHSNVALRTESLPTELLILADTTKLTQVMVNLIHNAIDAIEKLESRWIDWTASSDGDGVTITLTDSGNGIPESLRGSIFEPFFTTKPAGVGTGLGLSISSTLMQSMGGSLALDSEHPHTRFILRLSCPGPMKSDSDAPR